MSVGVDVYLSFAGLPLTGADACAGAGAGAGLIAAASVLSAVSLRKPFCSLD